MKRVRVWPFTHRPFYNLKNRARYRFKEWEHKRHMKKGKPFKQSQLLYVAYARCKGCGAGLAYHEGIGMHGQWDCSRVLTGRADPDERDTEGSLMHHTYPFVSYEINSENQPSARGATTRPKGEEQGDG